MTRLTPDEIAEALQKLRVEEGEVSYQDIASRITKKRIAAGMNPHAATVAKSTVYSCFKLGRTRVNASLVSEIVFALTDDEQAAAEWKSRCLAARRPAALPNEPAPAPSASDAHDVASRLARIRPPRFIALMILLGVIVDLVPYTLVQTFFVDSFPLFADMGGTAIVAVLLGPIWGAVTAILTALATMALAPIFGFAGPSYTALLFAPVAIVGALVWGYGIHKFHFGTNLLRFIQLNALVGVACTAAAFLVVTTAFNGYPMMSVAQQMTDSLTAVGAPQAGAVMVTNLTISLIDKMLAGLLALLVAGTFFRQYADHSLVKLLDPADSKDSTMQRRSSPQMILLHKPLTEI